MDHRYGRHGPRAWLKWRERHYVPVRNLPASTSGTKVYVYELSPTERIIYIVATSPNEFERDGAQAKGLVLHGENAPQALAEKGGEQPPPPRSLKPHEQIAQRQASDDINRILRLMRAGKFIVINPDGLEDHIDRLARNNISNEYVAGSSKPYEDLLTEYHDAYQMKFKEKLAEMKGKYMELQDEKEKALRLKLQDDRLAVKSRVSGDHHARDLALVRILQVYHPYELLDIGSRVLSGLHGMIDYYETYVLDTDGEREVIWPDQDTF